MAELRYLLVDADEKPLAELLVEEHDDGWFTGTVLARSFPDELERALAWYDEVVTHQMLSFLDEATSAVERWGLRVKAPDGSARRVCALHVSKPDDVSFRTTPVPPPSRVPADCSR
jgi:hypothetical protein